MAHLRLLTLHVRERRDPGHGQRPRPLRTGATGQQPLEALTPLRGGSSQLPEAPERRTDPEPSLHLATLRRPGERGTDIGELGIEPLEPAQLLRSEQCRLGLLRQLAVETGVAAADVIAVAALGQPLEGVLANRLQHPEAGLAAAMRLRPEQVVVQERLHSVDDVESGPSDDRLCAFESEAADEHCEAREERLLLRAEKVVAPLDRGTQGPVPFGHACAGSGPRRSSLPAEPLEDRARRRAA